MASAFLSIGSRDLVSRSSPAQPVPTRRPRCRRRADSHRHRAGSRPSPAPELCEDRRRAAWRLRRPGQAGWQLRGGGRRLRRPSLLSREGPALRWPGGTDSRCPQRSARASPAPRAVRPAGRARRMSRDLRRRRALHQDHASSSGRGGEPRLRVGSGHPLAGHREALSERTDLQEGLATFFLSRWDWSSGVSPHHQAPGPLANREWGEAPIHRRRSVLRLVHASSLDDPRPPGEGARVIWTRWAWAGGGFPWSPRCFGR